MNNKFVLMIFRNINDFKFGTIRLETHNDGSITVRGRLKKNDCISKYLEVKKNANQ